MPVRWEIGYVGVDPASVGLGQIHAVMSRVFDSSEIGHRAQRKPYTISPLGYEDTGATQLVSWLDDTSAAAAESALLAHIGSSVRFGSEGGVLNRVVRQAEWSFSDLAERNRRTSSRSDYRFRFHTPVTFRKGNRSDPMPYPSAVFGHLRRRWNDCCPPEDQIDVDFQSCELLTSYLEGRTLQVDLPKRGRLTGFEGEVAFETQRSATAESLSALAALGAFSEFAGVGANTTIGFGVTSFAG